MVQIIARPASFGERLGAGIGAGVSSGLNQYQQMKAQSANAELEHQRELEMIGEKARAEIEAKREFFQELFGKKEPKQSFAKEPQPSDEIEVGLDTLYTPEEIFQASLIDKTLANQMQKKNEFIQREKQHEENLAQKEREGKEKLDYQSFKDNKDYTNKVLEGYSSYKRDKAVLDQMKAITDKGNLPKPLLVSAFNKMGIPLGVLENPDAEQFEKLSQELVKNIQGTYGTRILQSEVTNFLKSIPTLMNSQEGQERLIRQWQILNESKRIYYDAYKDVRKDYPDRLPPDLHERVLDKADSRLDDMARKFRNLADIPSDYVKTPGRALVRSITGELGEINMEQLEQALKAGYEFLE